MKIKIKKLHPDAIVPIYATAGAACFDIHAVIDNDERAGSLLGGHVASIGTGLAFEVPPGFALKLFSRSGHGLKGVSLANGTGIIDSDYRGELKVLLINHSDDDVDINHGDRIAQAMIIPFEKVGFEVVEELSETERGNGGFGSTGK